MENVVKAAVVTGICGVIGCTITGYCSYQAGESSVEQKVDNKISQSVNVEGMGYEKAIEYIINESNKLQDKNEQLEEEKSNLQKKIEELEDRSDVDKRGGGERGVSDKQSESDGEEIAFSNTPDILYDGTNYKVYSGEDSFSVGGEKQKSGYVLRCTAINGDGVALFNFQAQG
jgi:FtsZ-binding cell division protein ZapB